ncbi:MAG: CoA-binding protein, partial [Acetobacteraceae bacterium]
MEKPPSRDDTGVGTGPTDDPPDLRRFFAPSSVALVGATADTSKFGGRCFRQLCHFGYRGRIYPVNPGRAELDGLRCYPSLTELPEPPDHVGIVVPGEAALTALRQAAALGAPFATIFTAGFAETGTERGRALQAEIRHIAQETGIRVMGPNCNGLVNFVDGFALTSTATISGKRAPAGDVGLASHSGGLGQVSVMWRAQQAGVPISYEVSCGNDADLDLLDYAGFMVDDPQTRVVLLLAERISDGAKLASLARRARDRDKPLLVLKLGRTEDGSRVAASHTGAVTGADAVHDAAFRQLGMIRVDDCAELYQTASVLRGRRPRSHRVGAMSLSGGHTVLIADIGAAAGLQWPEYTPETQRRLAELLPAFGHVGNPTDVTAVATGQPGLFRNVLQTLIADPNIDAMVPIITFARRAEIEEVAALARNASKPVTVLWTGTCSDDDTLSTRVFTDHRTPVFRDATPLLRALRRAADYVAFRALPTVTRPADIDPAAARAALGTGAPTEREAKRVLACYGLPVVPERLARSAEEAGRIAAGLRGRLALKIESPDIAHKTEAGGVRLD